MCSVVTYAWIFRNILEEYAKKTDVDISFVDFQLHNFGDRGASSVESAILGGMAHLAVFKGTDNFFAIKVVHEVYGDDYSEIAFSVPASEHSVALSWGKEKELEYVKHVLEVNKEYPIVSIVMDTYNIYRLVDMVTKDKEIRRMLEENDQKLVIRPDSGDHREVLTKILRIIEKNKWPYVENEKGYKVLQNLGIIYGDRINFDTIRTCLDVMIENGYSVSNIVFGCGGFLMQSVNRDTFGFSYKVSEVVINGVRKAVCKCPVTSQFKKSLSGRVVTVWNENEQRYEVVEEDKMREYHKDVMHVVFENGEVKRKHSLSDIRKRLGIC
jgi:nicotinamide phosphoribosyltransferase